ncbi:MAG: HAMP domain-containing histidine kinase, partial [Anaerolineae bacterium]|nr:HAMP domain-containing histidine kinase [Anaerolineae bacterium]
YLVKTLMEKYGGQLNFESTEGKGSRFWITMPRIASNAVTSDVEGQQTRPLIPDPNEVTTSELRTDIESVLEEEPGDTAPLRPNKTPVTRPLDRRNDIDNKSPRN